MPGYSRARGKRADGSTRWQARWRHPVTQERQERAFKTKTLAERWIKAMDTDALRGDYIDPRRGDRLYAVVADAWRSSWIDLQPTTRAGYESILSCHLVPEFGAMRVSSITPERVERYVRRMVDEDINPGTIRSIYAALRASLNTAVRLRMVATNPCIGVRLPRANRKEMLFLTAEEVTTVANAINPHFRVLVLTAAWTGLRAGELGGLRRRDVDPLRNRISVHQALKDLHGKNVPEAERGLVFGPTKTHARRTLTLPKFLTQELADHLASDRPGGTGPDDLVFTMPEGGPMRHVTFLSRYWNPAVRGVAGEPGRRVRAGRGYRTIAARPGLPAALPDKAGLRFHDLRHTCAALLIATGAHPKAVQDRLGHASITMTYDRYGHLLPGLGDVLADALDAAHTAAQVPSTNVRELAAAR